MLNIGLWDAKWFNLFIWLPTTTVLSGHDYRKELEAGKKWAQRAPKLNGYRNGQRHDYIKSTGLSQLLPEK